MAKEVFVHKKFTKSRLEIIDWINEILNEYAALGYDLTVRQVYYQLVTKDLIPNNPKSYKRIKGLISDARKAGLIDWDMIVDRTRKVVINSHWESPAEIVQAAADSFMIDKWANQPRHVEVMVEKEALAGILEPVCRSLDVPFTANKGYASDSIMYRAGERIERHKLFEGKELWILYFGDHDPSGMDMDRDIFERLNLYSGMNLEVRRLALLMDQIETMNVPENPAKTKDSRYEGYIALYGESSWELDAVKPDELVRLVTEGVENLRDEDLWKEAVEKEDRMRKELQSFADEYEDEVDD